MDEASVTSELRRAAELFDAAEYHAAHEVLDELWDAAAPDESDFFKGLIQAAIALHHHQRGNPDGARKLYRGHRQLLAAYLPRHRGLDVGAFLAAMQRSLGPLVSSRPGEGPAFDPEARPRMSFEPDA